MDGHKKQLTGLKIDDVKEIIMSSSARIGAGQVQVKSSEESSSWSLRKKRSAMSEILQYSKYNKFNRVN